MAKKEVRPLQLICELADSLAQRVFQLREMRNLTVKSLAKLARFPVSRIEDIESGVETWLSASDRQLLAKALNIEPMLLQEVEAKRLDIVDLMDLTKIHEDLSERILAGERDLTCPNCGSTMKSSIQQGLDLDGKPFDFAKAFCIKCPFVLR